MLLNEQFLHFLKDLNSASDFAFHDAQIERIFAPKFFFFSYWRLILAMKQIANETAKKQKPVFRKCVLEFPLSSISGVKERSNWLYSTIHSGKRNKTFLVV
jgi:hypothetical protein